ncbi:MAG: valine--tRNA ligase [Nitrospirota bacterium]
MKELNKVYNPHEVEKRWYEFWVKKGFFKGSAGALSDSFSIVIPPPNITGVLHMGHALNNTIQDILIRWKKMEGYNTLWLPGTDHAGIATQNVVENQLLSEGITRQDYGREMFIERVWRWRDESGRKIIDQLKRLGSSCDWERERFTMDKGLSSAVREVFVRLYREGYIYRGNYIINWCPRCETAISDLEVEHEEVKGKLYYITYPFVDGKGGITIATTRPETMLGDTAVAVSPADKRYDGIAGKRVMLPIAEREIPVIEDRYVDPEFGTGALKITPAHDPYDFEIGERHNLEKIKVINEKGIMNENAGRYRGKDRFNCRKEIIEELQKNEYIAKIEEYTHSIGHCYRCKTVIEPSISLQWFVSMKELVKPAIAAVKNGRIKFIPESWENTYFDWMNNIRDWCISRQIWWGHQIPAWYCNDCREIIVSLDTPEFCHSCRSHNLNQDTDVLDTWFSSALWPFSTLGWPEDTDDLKKFYPTSVLVTGFDILFFWVARMIIMGLKFTDEIPFRNVYVHALVRDIEGKKMSKSKGNVIDPLLVMDKYGTDAFRFTLSSMAAPGRDIKLSEERIEGYRNFSNKLWNAARFILMNIERERGVKVDEIIGMPLSLSDRWILSRLQRVTDDIRRYMRDYRFDEASNTIYHFIWHEFCAWYIEFIKPKLLPKLSSEERKADELSSNVILFTFESMLRLLHPFMPFITEEIWQSLPHDGESILLRSYPEADERLIDDGVDKEMEIVKGIISTIRNIRGEMNISPSRELNLFLIVKKDDMITVINTNINDIKRLAKLSDIKIGKDIERPKRSRMSIFSEIEVIIPLEGVIDLEKERERLKRELIKCEKEIIRSTNKLANEDFKSKARKEIVEKEEIKRNRLIDKRSKVKRYLKEIV